MSKMTVEEMERLLRGGKYDLRIYDERILLWHEYADLYVEAKTLEEAVSLMGNNLMVRGARQKNE